MNQIEGVEDAIQKGENKRHDIKMFVKLQHISQ